MAFRTPFFTTYTMCFHFQTDITFVSTPRGPTISSSPPGAAVSPETWDPVPWAHLWCHFHPSLCSTLTDVTAHTLVSSSQPNHSPACSLTSTLCLSFLIQFCKQVMGHLQRSRRWAYGSETSKIPVLLELTFWCGREREHLGGGERSIVILNRVAKEGPTNKVTLEQKIVV